MNNNCPHLTGVVYNGYEECDFGKACDLDCEWIELQKYKKALQNIKEKVSDEDAVACDYELSFDLAKEILLTINEVLK